jgi:hypothetical protein
MNEPLKWLLWRMKLARRLDNLHAAELAGSIVGEPSSPQLSECGGIWRFDPDASSATAKFQTQAALNRADPGQPSGAPRHRKLVDLKQSHPARSRLECNATSTR